MELRRWRFKLCKVFGYARSRSRAEWIKLPQNDSSLVKILRNLLKDGNLENVVTFTADLVSAQGNCTSSSSKTSAGV